MSLLEAERKQPTKPAFDPVEAGRRGGIKSGEVRRRKARGLHFLEVSAGVLKEDPEPIVRSVLAGGNAAAKVKLLELTWQWQQAEQRAAERGYQELDRKTTELDELACQLMDDVENEQHLKERLRAEVDELQRRRQELRQAIEQEAEQAGFELVDVSDDESGGDDAGVAQTAA